VRKNRIIWTNIDAASSFSLSCPCNVSIPDTNFKAYLVGNTAINTNGDTEIQCSEASAFSGGIYCSSLSITDLTGIEAFTSIGELQCRYNSLTTLNVSANTLITDLICDFNSLTALDISANTILEDLWVKNNNLTTLNTTQNTLLKYLTCSQNSITSLDLSSNTALTTLVCSTNSLSSLDVSTNTLLHTLFCFGNSISALDISTNTILSRLSCGNNSLSVLDLSTNTALTELGCNGNTLSTLSISTNTSLVEFNCETNSLISLNVANGNNTNFTYFRATSNPNLSCIEVDDTTYSTTNWANIDTSASFSINCATTTNIEKLTRDISLSVYPNPVTNQLNIEAAATIESIAIYNLLGKLVQTENSTRFNVQNLENGVYLLRIKTKEGFISKQFIKSL